MKLKEVALLLNAEILFDSTHGDLLIEECCGADLMSDVMAFVKTNVMLLTGLVNPQVIRTAEMMDIKVVTFVRGKKPTETMLTLAKELDIAIMVTEHPMFTSCGKLYQACKKEVNVGGQG